MNDLSIFFGDIHNHNALGYGKGSLERSIDIARTHLDFFAFTGHAGWHDIQPMEGDRQEHWLRGFERHSKNWPQIQKLAAANNRDGEFVQFLGYEWHSTAFGDHCVVFPGDAEPLFLPERLADLRAFCRERQALMIPHHLAYPEGMRGVNWSAFEPCACTPVVEIYSEHGNAEFDRGAFPYFTHSFGGRMTAHTAQAGLDRGFKFGFVASSDNHRGFPGAYGEGVMGVLAEDLSRDAIMHAVRARRTYGITGDRIELRLRAAGEEIGSEVEVKQELELEYAIAGRDEIELVELVHAGRTIRRLFPDGAQPADAGQEPVQVRVEWGWGPWKDLALERITDWRIRVELRDGRLARYFPCLQSGPFAEDKRHRFTRSGDNRVEITSYTSRQEAYRENPNQSAIFEIIGGPETVLDVSLEEPVRRGARFRLADLRRESGYVATGPFPKESLIVHRAIEPGASRVSGSLVLPAEELTLPGYLYFRIRQRNGQMAWSSPWFLR